MATLEDFQIPSNFDQKGGFATEQTLLEVRDALSKTNRVEQDGIGKFNKSTKDSAKDIKVFGTTIGKMNPALAALETGFNIPGSAITGATGLVKSLHQLTGPLNHWAEWWILLPIKSATHLADCLSLEIL